MSAKSLMIQGTMSSAGKSMMVTGLCRLFHQDGIAVAPFKSQNMALNSCVTEEGLEMGRAQAVQARAAGLEPSVIMNPILLKPTSDKKSQVVVQGKVWDTLDAKEYYEKKIELIPTVRESYDIIKEKFDLVILEGAGSPAEINLLENDFVNMGMAEIADAPVILVGDIDRGGVFAQLVGTMELLRPEERERVKGFIINKFRGDRSILEPGLRMLEELTGKPVLGVVPYLDVRIEEEDSLAEERPEESDGAVDIAVIRFPRLSNATDLLPLDLEEGVRTRYVSRPEELLEPDLILLPGTKSTMSDLKWMRENGLEAQILKRHADGCPVLGICGGFQMLGQEIRDPHHVEGNGTMRGMDLLPMTTEFAPEKTLRRVTGEVAELEGKWKTLSGKKIRGYEIHMGTSDRRGGTDFSLVDGVPGGACCGNVLGTYLHGIFEEDEFRRAFVALFRNKKKTAPSALSFRAQQEQQYDLLASALRESLDMEQIRKIIGIEVQEQ